jgi:hypothetical protein
MPERDDAPLTPVEWAVVRAVAAAYLRRRMEVTTASTAAGHNSPAGGKTAALDVPGNDEAHATLS